MSIENDQDAPIPTPVAESGQAPVESDSEVWAKRNEFHPFSHTSLVQDGFSTNLSIAETALVNSIKFGGINWTHSTLEKIAKNPLDLDGSFTDEDDDRILHHSSGMEGDSEIVGRFSYFITVNPNDESYRVHVFGFEVTDIRSVGIASGFAGVQPLPALGAIGSLGEPEGDAVIMGQVVEPEGWTLAGVSLARKRFHSLKPVRETGRAIRGLMNSVEKAAKEEGKGQVASLTKKGIRQLIAMAAKYIGSGMQ